MKRLKQTLHNVFLSVGLGTMIFVPMLILDNGLNETLTSILIWIGASVLYGISFELLEIKNKMRIPFHIAVCFIITVTVRCLYSYFVNGSVNYFSTILVTIPIFAIVYILLYFFMKYIGSSNKSSI